MGVGSQLLLSSVSVVVAWKPVDAPTATKPIQRHGNDLSTGDERYDELKSRAKAKERLSVST